MDTVLWINLSITSYWNIKMALIAVHLNAEVMGWGVGGGGRGCVRVCVCVSLCLCV